MRRDNLKAIGFVLMFVAIVELVICFDDIKAMVNEAMMEQTQSLVDQLLRWKMKSFRNLQSIS